MKANYLNAYIYKPHYGDCSNKGISSRFKQVALVCEDGNNSFDTETECPLNLCIAEKRNVTGGDLLTIYPAAVDECGNIVKRPGWWMFGGCYVGASDSRFNRKLRSVLGSDFYGAVAFHDRQE